MDDVTRSAISVFVVEDERVVSRDIVFALGRLGYTVAGVASNGEQAFSRILETHPDVVLIDIHLEGEMDGVSLAGKLRMEIDVPVIYLTAYSDAETLDRAKLTQPIAYILKPFDDRELRLNIEMAVYKHGVEQALRGGEVLFRTSFESAAIGIALFDLQGRCIRSNPAIRGLLGYDEREMPGMPFTELVHPADAAASAILFHELLAGKQIRHPMEKRFIRKGGQTVWMLLHLSLVPGPLGKPHYALVIVENITERKQTEERLRLSEEQFRLISENVADMIAVLDLEGKRLYNSPSYKNVLGDPATLRGTDSFQEIHPDDRERIRQVFAETVRTGVGQQMDYRFLLADGSIRHVESQGSVVKDTEGRVSQVIVVSRDVTEKKSLERQFLRAQRMESIGSLAGGIAHDLNNVLTPILMAIEILRRRLPGMEDQRILNTLEASASRGSHIIKQVLAFGRGLSGERIPVQVRHVIAEVTKIAEETFPKTLTLVTDVPKDLWVVSADATHLHQVLLNICVNARDAMPSGGTLSVSAENTTLDEQFSRMNPEVKPGSYVKIAVADTGEGIPAENLDKIFEPFFTTKDISHGTGLGLSTALAIVRSHGGFISVNSTRGEGTIFSVYLPASPDQEAEIQAPDLKEFMGSGELILVVDDEESILEITRETLEAHGYTVVTARDGAEAVVAYADRGQHIRAVITDMMMPVMDGASTMHALRKMNPAVKIVAVSGMALSTDDPGKLNREASAVLGKPYTARDLLGVLHDLLSGK